MIKRAIQPDHFISSWKDTWVTFPDDFNPTISTTEILLACGNKNDLGTKSRSCGPRLLAKRPRTRPLMVTKPCHVVNQRGGYLIDSPKLFQHIWHLMVLSRMASLKTTNKNMWIRLLLHVLHSYCTRMLASLSLHLMNKILVNDNDADISILMCWCFKLHIKTTWFLWKIPTGNHFQF